MKLIKIKDRSYIQVETPFSVDVERPLIRVTPEFYWAVPELSYFGVFQGSGAGGLYWRVPRCRVIDLLGAKHP